MQGKSKEKKSRPIRQKLVGSFTEIIESLLNEKNCQNGDPSEW